MAVGLIGCGAERPSPAASAGDRIASVERRAVDDLSARAASSDTMSSLRDIVTSGALVGRRVRVTGRCAVPTRQHVLGLPAHARATWRLEADGVAVFVTGPPPRQCSLVRGTAEVTISALVAEDTLPAIGELPPSPRRYLVQVDVAPPAGSR